MAKEGFRKSRFKRKPVGAAFIKGNRIVIGFNNLKTSPLSVQLGSRRGRIHAEVCVLKFLESCQGGHLYVYREKKDGSLGLSRPCSSCEVLIRKKGITTVTYTTETGFITEKYL